MMLVMSICLWQQSLLELLYAFLPEYRISRF